MKPHETIPTIKCVCFSIAWYGMVWLAYDDIKKLFFNVNNFWNLNR